MKKIFILLAVFSFVLSGCSGDNLKNVNKSSSKEIKIFEQPENKADVAGLVKNIVGNQVTILKIEMNGLRKSSEEMNTEKNDDSKVKTLTGITNIRKMGMGMGMSGRKPENMDEDSRSAMLEKMKEMSSGEEVVIIPVGIKMLKMDEDSREMVNADLTDITENSTISIWLNKEITDRQIADFVLIK
jgi:hypothetical protein